MGSLSSSGGGCHRRFPLPSFPLALFLFSSISLLRGADATVTLLSESTSRSVASYASRPAAFGNDFEWGLEYGARVQLPPDGDWWLCGDAAPPGDDSVEAWGGEEDDVQQEESAWKFRIRNLLAKETESRSSAFSASASASDGKGGVVVPPDGMPVVILARRGKCTYEQKAKVATAMLPPNAVRYLVVFDNVGESKLIEMASETGQRGEGKVAGVDVGMLFISRASGEDLIGAIVNQSAASRHAGGPRLLLDGYSRWYPGGDGYDPLTWMGAILLAMGCLLSCTCLFVSESIRGAGDGAAVAVRRRERVTLLTEEEVRTLPEIVFREDGHDKPVGAEDGKEKAVGANDGKDEEKDAKENASGKNEDNSPVDKNDLTTPLLEESASFLPPSSLHENFDNTACSICLEEYCDGHRLRVLPCHHAFHSHCIGPWLTRRSPTCPLCKADFEGVGGDEEDNISTGSSDEPNEADEVTAGEGEEETGTRTIARMLGINLEAATGRVAPRRGDEGGPRFVRIRAPELSDEDDDSSDSDSSTSSTVFGFWRFVFRQHRGRRDEEESVSVEGRQQVQEISVAAAEAIRQQQEEDDERAGEEDAADDDEGEAAEPANEESGHQEEGEEEERAVSRAEASSSANIGSLHSMDDLESGRRSQELREPLLAD